MRNNSTPVLHYHLLLLLLGILVSGRLFAHADLLGTQPENGVVLETSPEQFVVQFSEPVSLIRVQLLNQDRESLALTPPDIVNAEMRFAPASPLLDGQYLMSFRVLSLDAHPVSGSVGFAIGDLPAPIPSYQAADPVTLLLARLNRSVQLLSILACIGMVLFPLLYRYSGKMESHRQRYLNITVWTGIVTTIAELGWWGVLLLGDGPVALFQADSWRLAADSSVWNSALIAMAGFSGILLANFLDPVLAPGRFAAVLGAVLLAASFGASGHAATTGLLTTTVFVIHAAMAGLWLGALWLLYQASRRLDPDHLYGIMRVFSRRATLMVGILLVCALILLIHQLSSPAQLVQSAYGRWVLLKAGLVLLVLALAAVNRWRLVPTLATGGTPVAGRLRRTVVVEAMLMVLVVIVTSILASTAPPPADRQDDVAELRVSGRYGLTAGIRVTPATTGPNTMALKISQNGGPITPLEVHATWQHTDAGIEPVEREAIRDENGDYIVNDMNLLIGGRWQLRVDVLIDDFTRAGLETDLLIE